MMLTNNNSSMTDRLLHSYIRSSAISANTNSSTIGISGHHSSTLPLVLHKAIDAPIENYRDVFVVRNGLTPMLHSTLLVHFSLFLRDDVSCTDKTKLAFRFPNRPLQYMQGRS